MFSTCPILSGDLIAQVLWYNNEHNCTSRRLFLATGEFWPLSVQLLHTRYDVWQTSLYLLFHALGRDKDEVMLCPMFQFLAT
jgi:hypothetical protein